MLLSIPNIVFIITGVYFAIVAATGEASVYTAVGAVLCFVSAALAYRDELFFSSAWRIATAAFSMVVLLAQVSVDFTVTNPSAIVIASILVNGVLFVLMLGVLLIVGRDLTVSRENEEEKEEEQTESKKKRLTYEI